MRIDVLADETIYQRGPIITDHDCRSQMYARVPMRSLLGKFTTCRSCGEALLQDKQATCRFDLPLWK